MRGLWLSLVFAACGPGGKRTETPKSGTALTPQDIVKLSSPAIVRVEAQGPDGEQFGTGFIVGKDGVVATNLHVIKGTSEIKVKFNDGTHYTILHVLNLDPGRDLVLMKFKPEKALPTLSLGDSNKVATGEKIVAIGNPLGVFEQTVSEGLISSIRDVCSQNDVDSQADMQKAYDEERKKLEEELRKRIEENKRTGNDDGRATGAWEAEARRRLDEKRPQCPIELHLLQISAPISQGSSGGPLFNQRGEVVGVTTAIIAQGQLINFAMPVNYLKPLMQKQEVIALDDFAKATRVGEEKPDQLPKKPPMPEFAKDGFPVAIYNGCTPVQVEETIKAIWAAIDIGAPLYNEKKFEACARIYEGVAIKFEKDSGCKGIRTVYGDVLLKVQATDNFAEKAWHLRYTFDGLVKAEKKWPGTNKP